MKRGLLQHAAVVALAYDVPQGFRETTWGGLPQLKTTQHSTKAPTKKASRRRGKK